MAKRSIKELDDLLKEYRGYIIGNLEALSNNGLSEDREKCLKLKGKQEMVEAILYYTSKGSKAYLKIK